MTWHASKQVTSPPWNSRRQVHSKEMVWASRWSVALRTFYRQILSLLYIVLFSSETSAPGSPGNYLYRSVFNFIFCKLWKKLQKMGEKCFWVTRKMGSLHRKTWYFPMFPWLEISNFTRYCTCCLLVLILPGWSVGNHLAFALHPSRWRNFGVEKIYRCINMTETEWTETEVKGLQQNEWICNIPFPRVSKTSFYCRVHVSFPATNPWPKID